MVEAALLHSVFQFGYTTVFGGYTAFLFLRTGEFIVSTLSQPFKYSPSQLVGRMVCQSFTRPVQSICVSDSQSANLEITQLFSWSSVRDIPGYRSVSR